MQLETTRFGSIDVDPGAIITLTQPIIGFQDNRRFLVLPGPPGSVLKWLQSAEVGHLAFLMLDPRVVLSDYRVTLSSIDLTELGVSGPEELDIYTLVVVPKDPAQVRTNLKAPILINPKLRLGKQAVMDKSDYPVQYFLARNERAPQAPREADNARSNA